MQRYTEAIDVSLLQQSATARDPVGFVLSEELIVYYTKARVPALKPSTVLFPDRWKKYKRRKDLLDRTEEMIDEMWFRMVESIVTAAVEMVAWQAGEAKRRLEWAESLRVQDDSLTQQLTHQGKLAELQDRMAALSDRRTLTHQLSVTKINHIYNKEMAAIQLNQDDPAYKAERYKAAMELIKPELDAIAASSHTTAVKNQLSRAYLDALKLILR